MQDAMIRRRGNLRPALLGRLPDWEIRGRDANNHVLGTYRGYDIDN